MPAPPPWLPHVARSPSPSGESDAPRTGLLYLGGVIDHVNEASTASREKFIDPHFTECWTKAAGGAEGHRGDGGYEKAILSQGFRELYDMAGDQEVGLEYLGGVPNNARDRVAAMRARIEARNTPATQKRYSKYRDKSGDGIGQLSRKIAEVVAASSSPEKAKALAASLGVPVAQAESVRAELQHWLDTTAAGEFAKILWSNVGPQVMTLARQTVAEIAHDLGATANSIGTALDAVPIVGAMVSSFTFVLDEIRKQDEIRKNSTCAGYLDEIHDRIARLSDNGMPPPWHITDLGLDCRQVIDEKRPGTPLSIALGTTTSTEYYTLGPPESLKGNTWWDGESYVGYGSGLLPLDQVALKKWWSLATLLWSDKDVGPVMNTMGADYWGGALASDEQVMLIAAPIAVSYGLDVDAFARKLWMKSEGWQARPGFWVKRAGGGCGKVVDNARVLQFAVLARDAFELAEAVKAGAVSVPPRGAVFSPMAPLRGSRGPLLLGALVAGGLAWWGIPYALASVPFAIGAALSSGRQRPTAETKIAEMRPSPPRIIVPDLHLPTFTLGFGLGQRRST